MKDRKITLLFIGMGGLNFLLCTVFNFGVSGSEAGMAPFMVAFFSLFALVIATMVYWLSKIWTDSITLVKSVFIYQTTYLLVLFFLIGWPASEGELSATASFSIYLLSFLVTLIAFVVLKSRERQKSR